VIHLLLALGLAQATDTRDLGLVAEPKNVVAQFRAAAKDAGQSGPDADLDCRPAFDDLLFCLTKRHGDEWRYATQADLAVWKLTSEQAHIEAVGSLHVVDLGARLQVQTVSGMPGQYRFSNADDGRDVAPLLKPDALAALMGGAPVVAVPAQGAVVVWKPGDAALDKVLAVGVRKIFDQASHPISPRIYRWNDGEWTVWGEAVKP